MQSRDRGVTHRLSIWAVSAGVGSIVACASDLPPLDPELHRAEIAAWHAQRIEALRRPDGWFSHAGLYWLDPGESTFGSDSGNAIVFPAFAPSRIGAFVRTGDRVTMRVEGRIPVTHQGRVVDSLNLLSDGSDGNFVPRLGSLRWGAFKQADRVGVWLQDSANPAIAEFGGIETFPISVEWVLPARFERYDPPKVIRLSYAFGGVWEAQCPGAIVFVANGETLRLDAIDDGEQLFFVFGDRTNANETYGGGRFLWLPLPDERGRMFIDFNRAENPPCAFTAFTSCPLPPRQNQLPVRIEAGEKAYKNSGH